LVGRQEGHLACKKWGDGGGGHWLVWMEWRPVGWSVSASVNLLLHHKVQKFSSGTGSRVWSRKQGRKMVVWCGYSWVSLCGSGIWMSWLSGWCLRDIYNACKIARMQCRGIF